MSRHHPGNAGSSEFWDVPKLATARDWTKSSGSCFASSIAPKTHSRGGRADNAQRWPTARPVSRLWRKSMASDARRGCLQPLPPALRRLRRGQSKVGL